MESIGISFWALARYRSLLWTFSTLSHLRRQPTLGAQRALARLLAHESGESFSKPLLYFKGSAATAATAATAALGVAPFVVHRNDGGQPLAEAAVDCALALINTGSHQCLTRAYHFRRERPRRRRHCANPSPWQSPLGISHGALVWQPCARYSSRGFKTPKYIKPKTRV